MSQTGSCTKMLGKKCLVVGLSGATNSGKSSTAAMLAKKLPNAETIGQDSYFMSEGDPRVELNIYGTPNWEKHSALEMDIMVRDIQSWIDRHSADTTASVLIVEGFLMFDYSPLNRLFDKKFFIEVTKEASADRRGKRVYNPPDVPGYFESTVWPEYLLHFEAIKDQADIEYIDGTEDLESVVQKIFTSIQRAMKEMPA